MVLLAAAVCNKAGKVIVSRQFVEMTRSRIEGLLAAFPKLMTSGQQHTFVETDSVRYVYQPLEKLYMLLITTKASNILEDLETLRLFARVVPEYCRQLDEADIRSQAFPLIFAFDEIVALGYRESVNLAQVRTFTEMDSHEEKVYQAVRLSQEKEAREQARRMAKEMTKTRLSKMHSDHGVGKMGGSSMLHVDEAEPERKAPPSRPAVSTIKGKAMSLKKGTDNFFDQLRAEGETVLSPTKESKLSISNKPSTPAVNEESVHLRIEEKINASAGRDGGLQSLEVLGMIQLKVSTEEYACLKIKISNNDQHGAQIVPHPNIDKKLFNSTNVLALKNPNKPFPLNQEAGILRWRFQTSDESNLPLTINCWPNETDSGCDVNIEYELENVALQLDNVIIGISAPSGVGSPVVHECEGEYQHDARKGILEWRIPVIDESNKNGSMEFSMDGKPDDFFPININFVSLRSFCKIAVVDVVHQKDDCPVKYSKETLLYVGKYEIV